MNLLKRIIVVWAVASLTVFVIGYFIGAVTYAAISLSLSAFNILEWGEVFRGLLVAFSLLIGLAVAASEAN